MIFAPLSPPKWGEGRNEVPGSVVSSSPPQFGEGMGVGLCFHCPVNFGGDEPFYLVVEYLAVADKLAFGQVHFTCKSLNGIIATINSLFGCAGSFFAGFNRKAACAYLYFGVSAAGVGRHILRTAEAFVVRLGIRYVGANGYAVRRYADNPDGALQAA